MSDDILLGLKDIKNYSEPNFIGENNKLYLVRCYQCPDPGRGKHHQMISEFGKENYVMNVALGVCTWCGWKPDPEVVEEIVKRRNMRAAQERGDTEDDGEID